MIILKFSLKRTFRNFWAILLSFILPAGLLLLPVFWEGESFVVGRGYFFILIIIMLGAFPLTQLMVDDKKQKTIVRIMSTPTTTFKYLSQNFAASMTPLMLQIIFICIFGFIRYSWEIGFTLQLGLVYTLFAATSVSLAMAWNCLFKNAEVNMAALTTFAMFSLFFGIFVSVDQLNNALRTIGMLFPSYWASVGIETLIDNGLSFDFLMPMGVLALFTVIFLLYGSKRGAY